MKLTEMSFRTRIFLSGLVVAILAMALGIVSYNQVVRNRSYVHLYDHISNMDNALLKVEQVLPKTFMYSQQNDSFLLQKYFYSFKNQFDAFVQNDYLTENRQVREMQQLIEKSFTDIQQSANVLSNEIINRNGKDGSTVRLNKRMNELFALVLPTDEIYTQLIITRKLLVDYNLNPNLQTYHKLQSAFASVKNAALTFNPAKRMAFFAQWVDFENDFNIMFKADVNIGFTPDEGLRGELQQHVRSLRQVINVSRNHFVEQSNHLFHSSLVNTLSILLVLLISFVLFFRYMYKSVIDPITRIKGYIGQLVTGKLPEPLQMDQANEISEMADQLNSFVKSLKEKAAFADEIGKGELQAHYEPLSSDDILGNSLLEMENSLQRAELEDRKYKLEEQKRIWANEGLARFAEIMRLNSSNLQTLSDEITCNLVQYLNAALGGLFLVNETHEKGISIELVASFAYDRKKYLQASILPGEGLLGTCYLEKQTIFLTDIPDDYILVKSGLGESSPKSLLIVPLKIEQEMLGVIELASFKIFEKHEVEFAEKIAESIASTISMVRINARTAELLEQSQKQAVEMADQEEEMRQNMEELQATQEESARREAEFNSVLNALHSASLLIELDLYGNIRNLNESVCLLLGVDGKFWNGKNLSELFTDDSRSGEWRTAVAQFKTGTISTFKAQFRGATGSDCWLMLTLVPVKDQKGNSVRIMGLAQNVSDEILMREELLVKEESYNQSVALIEYLRSLADDYMPICEILPGGKIDQSNDAFSNLSGYSSSELLSRKVTSLVAQSSWATFENILRMASKGARQTGTIDIVGAGMSPKTVNFELFPIKKDNQVSKILMICR
jgi:PAS domain S-box-containing protein